MGGARRSYSDRGAPASALLSAGTGTQPGRERCFVLLTWRILLVKISLICLHRGALEEGVLDTVSMILKQSSQLNLFFVGWE